MAKLRAVLFGATGLAGQQFVSALRAHPWFELAAVAASPRNAGRRYAEALSAGGWFLAEPIPADVASMVLLDPSKWWMGGGTDPRMDPYIWMLFLLLTVAVCLRRRELQALAVVEPGKRDGR